MPTSLCCWIGNTDLKAATGDPDAGVGPIAQALAWGEFDQLHLFTDYEPDRIAPFLSWLTTRGAPPLKVHACKLSRPTAFDEIYQAVVHVLDDLIARDTPELLFHLSPGTPAMAAVWIILARTRYTARLIESSKRDGVLEVRFPFNLSAEYVPAPPDPTDERIRQRVAAEAPASPAFDAIIHQSEVMRRVLALAERAARHSVPVLIEGESGTGKELLARATHHASPRRDRPFIAINCGAIPAELVESELFGHKKGAFTGAIADRPGHFERAKGGTLFLDEVGELPLAAQVKLLRVLQEREVTRVGDATSIQVDVRVIAATNRNLLVEASVGRFRADLFYRLAVAVIVLPPLRQRPGDLGLLIDRLLEEVNRDGQQVDQEHKNLSVHARNLLLAHPWPGNVRELRNTLHRAAIWSVGPVIEVEDARAALLTAPPVSADGLLDRPLGPGLDLETLQADLARHYLRRALVETGGNKTKAAALVGLASYQTLTNWMKRYGIEE